MGTFLFDNNILDNSAAGNEMPDRTERNKLPHEWCWTPAMVHLGTYSFMNISQRLKLPEDAVTAAETHELLYCKGLRSSRSITGMK